MFKSLIKRIVIEKTNLIVQKKIEIAIVVVVVVVDENIVDENDVDERIFKKLKIDINFKRYYSLYEYKSSSFMHIENR